MSMSVYGSSYSIIQNSSSLYGMTFLRTNVLYTHEGDSHEGDLIDHQIEGNRLYQRSDGSIEIIPKAPGEVVGEYLIRPMLDTTYDLSMYTWQILKKGFCYLDGIFSKTISFFPGIEAKSNQEQLGNCIAVPVEIILKGGDAAMMQGDPVLMEKTGEVGAILLRQCNKEHTESEVDSIYESYRKQHKDELEKMQRHLKECRDLHGDCQAYKKGCEPERFQETVIEHQKEETESKVREWVTTPGYLCWKIYITKWLRPDPIYDQGSYNCNEETEKPTVTTRQSLY